ncbi:MAG TPA: hypothetical protein DCM05_12620 [Elusimicrobia bacterium]|nr:hypothetical protein [Elusimicrobiota bacterium]
MAKKVSSLTPLVLAAFAAFAPSSGAAAQASFSASSAEESQRVDYLEDKATELKDAVANPTLDNQDIHALASRLFERLPEETTADVPAVNLRGWKKPDLRSEESVDGLMQKMREGLETNDVPPPAQDQMLGAYQYGEAMRKASKMYYDQEDELQPGQIGAYVYTKDSAIKIIFNKGMRLLQRFLGDDFAAATAVHEAGHTRDHFAGELNPVQVRKGEKLAFQSEYWWLKIIDPTGEKLSFARASIGKFATGKMKAPESVCEYLEHLASIRDYGDKGDFDGLVDSLGYKDRKTDPFAPQPKPEQDGN